MIFAPVRLTTVSGWVILNSAAVPHSMNGLENYSIFEKDLVATERI